MLGVLIIQILISTCYFLSKNRKQQALYFYVLHVFFMCCQYFIAYFSFAPKNTFFEAVLSTCFVLEYYMLVKAFLVLFNIRYKQILEWGWLFSAIAASNFLQLIVPLAIDMFVTVLLTAITPLIFLLYCIFYKVRAGRQPSEITFVSYSVIVIVIAHSILATSEIEALSNTILATQIVVHYAVVLLLLGHLSTTFAIMMVISGQKEIQLKLLAEQDGLTQTLNRRSFFDRLEKLSSNQGCLIMIDADHFKNINDNFGHQAGDAALVFLAQTIKSSISQQDILARYGGEEFIIFISNVNIKESELVANRIREAIESQKLTFNSTAIHITVSLGVSELKGKTYSEAIAIADERLYKAKNAGRNQVCSY